MTCQLTEWFTRILEREAVVLFDHDDRPVTSTPEDLLQVRSIVLTSVKTCSQS